MRNTEIMSVPYSEILELVQTNPQKFFEYEKHMVLAFLKNFDRYYVLGIINPANKLIDQYIKLPIKFVESIGNDNYMTILNEFLKITGIRFPKMGNKQIVSMLGKKIEIHMHPKTWNRAKYMTFGIETGKSLEFFFSIDIIKYRDFLEKYHVKIN